jgi:hypothetical protein
MLTARWGYYSALVLSTKRQQSVGQATSTYLYYLNLYVHCKDRCPARAHTHDEHLASKRERELAPIHMPRGTYGKGVRTLKSSVRPSGFVPPDSSSARARP